MMSKFLTFSFLILLSSELFSQVGINTETPDPSAALDIQGTNQGVLLPRLSNTRSITNPPEGLLVYDTTNHCISEWTSTEWKCLGTGGGSAGPSFFYAPGVNIDIDSLTPDSNGLYTYDVYQEYQLLFSTPKAKGTSAPPLTLYTKDQLYYYILDYDSTSFSDVSISDDGIMTFKKVPSYDISRSYFSIVFTVK